MSLIILLQYNVWLGNLPSWQWHSLMAVVLQTGKCALLHPNTAKELLREHDEELKVLTPYSLDPNLIEHLWDVSKQV